MDEPGVTIAMDASFDSKMYESYDVCVTYWEKNYERKAVTKPLPAQLSWNGLTLHLDKLPAEIKPFLRFVEIQKAGAPTGRQMLVLEMGRIHDSKLVSQTDRFRSVETMADGGKSVEVNIFDKAKFDVMNKEVRNYWATLSQCLLGKSCPASLPITSLPAPPSKLDAIVGAIKEKASEAARVLKRIFRR
jgi:hypothetical protein